MKDNKEETYRMVKVARKQAKDLKKHVQGVVPVIEDPFNPKVFPRSDKLVC